jgi:hypothetical protein
LLTSTFECASRASKSFGNTAEIGGAIKDAKGPAVGQEPVVHVANLEIKRDLALKQSQKQRSPLSGT